MAKAFGLLLLTVCVLVTIDLARTQVQTKCASYEKNTDFKGGDRKLN